MSLYSFIQIKARQVLQPIDVLRVVSQQELLGIEQLDEIVGGGWFGALHRRKELVGDVEEGARIVEEVVEREDGRWVRQVVLVQSAVETEGVAAEVGNVGVR